MKSFCLIGIMVVCTTSLVSLSRFFVEIFVNFIVSFIVGGRNHTSAIGVGCMTLSFDGIVRIHDKSMIYVLFCGYAKTLVCYFYDRSALTLIFVTFVCLCENWICRWISCLHNASVIPNINSSWLTMATANQYILPAMAKTHLVCLINPDQAFESYVGSQKPIFLRCPHWNPRKTFSTRVIKDLHQQFWRCWLLQCVS